MAGRHPSRRTRNRRPARSRVDRLVNGHAGSARPQDHPQRVLKQDNSGNVEGKPPKPCPYVSSISGGLPAVGAELIRVLTLPLPHSGLRKGNRRSM